MMIEKAPHLTSLLVLLHKTNLYSLYESQLVPMYSPPSPRIFELHTDGVDLVITELAHPSEYNKVNKGSGAIFQG